MKRIDSLISFSHDHHHALSQARRLSKASTGSDAHRRDVAHAFLQFFRHEVLVHFEDEEQCLFPCADTSDDAELHTSIATALAEHATLRERAEQLCSGDDQETTPDASQLTELGELLTSHIRFEERVVFALLQAHVAERTIVDSVGERTALNDGVA